MSGFHVRESTPADWDAVAEGFARIAHRNIDAVRPRVRWAMAENPAGSSGVVAVNATGEVVGHLGVSHIPMFVRGEERTFGRFYASFLDPQYRLGGLHSVFLEMDETFEELYENAEGLAAVFGWWDEADWWFLRHVRGHEAVLTSLSLRRAPGPMPPHEPSEEVEVFDATTEPWDDPLLPGECRTRHDGALARWRHGPAHPRDRAWIAVRYGRVVGVAAARDRAEERVLLDWSIEDGDVTAAPALIRAVVGDGTRSVHMPSWGTRGWTLEFLQACGFRVEAGHEAYLSARISGRGINQLWLGDHWQVTAADVGLTPLPRMTIGEQIVTPPPAGTRNAHVRYGY